MSLRSLVRTGPSNAPLRVILQGQEGVGKTTWASKCPRVLFLTCEDGGGDLDIARIRMAGWSQLIDVLTEIERNGPDGFEALALDTIDGFERLLWQDLCIRNKWESIGTPDYGRGYIAAADDMADLQRRLDRIRELWRLPVILLAHVHVKSFQDPLGASYDRYEARMHKNTAALWSSWADAILFAAFEATVMKAGRAGRAKLADDMEKGKATALRRVVYTSKDAGYDAKNRHGLPDELPMEWAAFASAIRWGQRVAAARGWHESWPAGREAWEAELAKLELDPAQVAAFLHAKGGGPERLTEEGRTKVLARLRTDEGRQALSAWAQGGSSAA